MKPYYLSADRRDATSACRSCVNDARRDGQYRPDGGGQRRAGQVRCGERARRRDPAQSVRCHENEGETHHGARLEKKSSSPACLISRRSGAMGWRGTVSVLVPPRAVNTAGPSHTSTRNSCYSPAAGRSMSAGSSPVAQCRDWCWAKCSSCCCNGCLAQSDGVVERRCHHVACSHLQRRFGQTHLGRTIETGIVRKKRVS